MCRSIKTLRPPALPDRATDDEIRAAALQYVRKVSGFRAPAAHNKEVFDRAVDAVAAATAALLADLEVRGAQGVSAGTGRRRISSAAPAPAPNSATNETPVASQVVPSHWPPK